LKGLPSHRSNNLSWGSGTLVAYGSIDRIRVDDISSGEARSLPLNDSKAVMEVRFVTLDCKEYLAAASDQGVFLFDGTGETMLGKIPMKEFPINEDFRREKWHMDYCCGLDGVKGTPFLATGTSQGHVALLYFNKSKPSLEMEKCFPGHKYGITAMTSTISYLCSGDESGGIQIWDAGSFEHVDKFPSFGTCCTSLRSRSDTLFSAFETGCVRIYKISSSMLIHELDCHCRTLNTLDLHPLKDIFATGGDDGFVNVWILPDDSWNGKVEVLTSEEIAHNDVVGVAFARENRVQIAATCYDSKTLTIQE